MGPLELVKLDRLMERSSGRSEIVIGLIDGPVAMNHPDLARTTYVRSPEGKCLMRALQQHGLSAWNVCSRHTFRETRIFGAGHLSGLHSSGAADFPGELPRRTDRCRAQLRKSSRRPSPTPLTRARM